MKNWVIPYELIIQKQFWGHLQKVDYLLNQMSYEKIQRGKKVPPWILPANLPLLEAPSLFLMKYEPRKQFDWLLFIFFLTSFTKGVLGFWGIYQKCKVLLVAYPFMSIIWLLLQLMSLTTCSHPLAQVRRIGWWLSLFWLSLSS
jgi:hypothetical protein